MSPPKMVDLHASRWAPASSSSRSQSRPSKSTISNGNIAAAPPTPNPTLTQIPLSISERDLLARRRDLTLYARLLRRLRWKSTNLLYCHHRSLLSAQAQNQSHAHPNGSQEQGVFAMQPGDAETMFKIDFFEFYVLLERTLVCLLGVFGMVVDAGHPSILANGEGGRDEVNGGAIIGDSRAFYGYAHRFHANVLSALDNTTCPLHEVLGTGTVREYLGVAKEFRNRWKDVEDRPEGLGDDGDVEWVKGRLRRYEKVLKDLRLEEMLGCILEGLDRCSGLGMEDLERREGRFSETRVGKGNGFGEGMMELDMEDSPWEAMPDAMEWD